MTWRDLVTIGIILFLAYFFFNQSKFVDKGKGDGKGKKGGGGAH